MNDRTKEQKEGRKLINSETKQIIGACAWFTIIFWTTSTGILAYFLFCPFLMWKRPKFPPENSTLSRVFFLFAFAPPVGTLKLCKLYQNYIAFLLSLNGIHVFKADFIQVTLVLAVQYKEFYVYVGYLAFIKSVGIYKKFIRHL